MYLGHSFTGSPRCGNNHKGGKTTSLPLFGSIVKPSKTVLPSLGTSLRYHINDKNLFADA
jgi:hypothetical protein